MIVRGLDESVPIVQDTKAFMRKIERQMNFAISNKGNWSGSNTSVSYNDSTNCSSIYLHGHQIATFDHNLKAVKLSSCGYETVTTKSRLNAILQEVKYGCSVFQKNFNWFVSYRDETASFWDGMILLDCLLYTSPSPRDQA